MPKSSNPTRMKENLGVSISSDSLQSNSLTVELQLVSFSEGDLEAVSAIHKGENMHRSLDALLNHQYEFNKDSAMDGKVFGWSMEQLGWAINPDGTVKST